MDYYGIKIKKFMIYNSEIITEHLFITQEINTQVIKTQVIKTQVIKTQVINTQVIKTQVIIINKHTDVI